MFSSDSPAPVVSIMVHHHVQRALEYFVFILVHYLRESQEDILTHGVVGDAVSSVFIDFSPHLVALPKHFVGAGLACQRLLDYGVLLDLIAPRKRFCVALDGVILIWLFVVRRLGAAVAVFFDIGCLLEVQVAENSNIVS